MINLPLPRLDQNPELREHLLRYCRFTRGTIWEDPDGRHRIGCLDAASTDDIKKLMEDRLAALAIHDPPYNLVAFERRSIESFIVWCRLWIDTSDAAMLPDSSLYLWLGADQQDGFQPLPDVMIMMRETPFQPRSYITMRNQRGYGTQKNWMAVRQELLYYIKGNPTFNVSAEYTDIPKILRGYYKEVGGEMTENIQRSRSENIRAGNVWVDIQQIFYRMEENVNGCYAQKPLKAIERIVTAGSKENDMVIDWFSHSGSTLIAAERLQRRCCTLDIDPVYCEITLRRLERLRSTGTTGWQNSNPFEAEVEHDSKLKQMLSKQKKE